VTRGRRVALVVAGVGLVGIAGVVVAAFVATRNSDRLLAGLGRGLGREIRAGGIGFSLRGGVGVALDHVAIADDPAVGSDEPFLAADRLAMRLSVLPLLQRRVVVDEVVVERPVVNLIRDRAGHLNVDSLGGRSRKPSAPDDEAGSGRSAAFQLGALRLRHGTIRYREATTGRAMALEDVAVDARQPRWDGPVPVSVRARLTGGDLHLDNMTSEGVLELADAHPTYHGSLTAGPGALGTLALARVTAEVRAAPPAVDLDAATVELLGGTVTGTGHVSAEGVDAGVSARLDGHDLDLEKLPAGKGPRPAGKLALQGAVAGPPPGAGDFRTAATGHGGFGVADGRIEGASFGRPLLEALKPFLRQGFADRLRDRYPDLFASDDLRFTKLAGTGRLANGRIRSDDLVLAAPSYEAHGEGSLGLDGDVDATVRLAASPALTEDILGSDARARAVLVDERGQLTVPLRVRGPVRRPHVSPDPAFAGTVARALLGSGVGEAAGDLLQRLLGGHHRR
jgi:uncharacterized protein involved in outer membrane biogenesis